MKSITAYGRIERGRKVYYNEPAYLQAIMELGNVSSFKETLEYGQKRTHDQNAYLWGGIITPVLVRLQQEGWAEFDKDDVYYYLQRRFSRTRIINERTGEIWEGVKPLKKLTTAEWDEIVIGKIRDWAEHDLGIYIQLPHEYYKMSLSAYDRWKAGEISKAQAVKESDPHGVF